MGFTAQQEDFFQSQPVFQPYQIVCLEHAPHRLYAEVVQLAERRPVCWVRPLALVEDPPDHGATPIQSPSVMDHGDGANLSGSNGHSAQIDRSHYYDLRDGADLLLPPHLFRVALDTEVIPLLSLLYSAESSPTNPAKLHGGDKKFSQFLHQVCQAYPDAF